MKTYVAVTSGMKPGDTYEFDAVDDVAARALVGFYMYADEICVSLTDVTNDPVVRVLQVGGVRPLKPEPEKPPAFFPRPASAIPGAMTWSPPPKS